MNKVKYFALVALMLGSATTFAGKDSSFHIQNAVRVGYDDNIYQSREGNQQESAFITDIINISGKMAFSSRSELTYFWQPEFRYRFDADPEFISFQDLYARLSHAVSQRTFLEVSDRFRYQEKDGQSDARAEENQNYFENDLMGALSFTLNALSQIRVGGGYEFRKWDDESYGAGFRNNDYDQYKADGSYIREIRPNTTHLMAGVNYVDHEYNGDRGGYDSTSLFGGVDHNFNPNMLGTARLGYSLSNVDGATGSQDADAPYLQAGLEYNPTDRTSVNGSLGYSLYLSENTIYNAQDRFNVGIGVKHDLTGKISISAALSYIFSAYDGAYAQAGAPGDAEEDFISLSLRGSYQINRNNFLDLGYEFTQRATDSVFLQEYNRNRFDFGWRLRL
ncbi:MAG: hypothetical protein DRP64_08260 [Verrucomicrobia bacterium]|nr:MAG: hypothetical protein DRP64_08260 [Verrucomicrobiota bacterium]